MGKPQRTKGACGERELCALLSAEFGTVVKRNLGQARDSGHDVTLPPFAIEAKRRKRIAGLYEWMKQCEGGTPVVAVRADGEGWLMVMRFEDWTKLAREELG